MMKILITGGTGLIGSALIQELLIENNQLHILTRNKQRAETRLPTKVNVLQWDGVSSSGWGRIISDVDAIINLAGESIAGESLPAIMTKRWTDQQKKRIKQSRINAGQAILEAIERASKKPDIIIQSSAVGYYGSQGEKILSEDTPAGTDFLANVCETWEKSTYNVNKLGVRHVIIRTGLVLSSRGGILPIMALPFRMFIGGSIGSGNQYIPWIHIRDQVKAIKFLLSNNNADGAYNLTAPNPITNSEFSKVLSYALRRPNYFPTPAFALKTVMGEKATLVLDGQRAVPQKLLNEGYKFHFEEVELALRDLL
jgi:uncharacterized protein (TIGR01777 family)